MEILSDELRAFERFFDGMPYISQFVFRFYSDEESLIDGYLRKEVSGMQGISADGISRLSERKSTVIRTSRPPAHSLSSSIRLRVSLWHSMRSVRL